jgi:hypothetical protein
MRPSVSSIEKAPDHFRNSACGRLRIFRRRAAAAHDITGINDITTM